MALTLVKANSIIDTLFSGMSLKETLRNQGVHAKDFFDFIDSVPKLANRYARAQQARSELLVEEIVEIADNEPDPQKARVRTDARKWYASKMQPQKYGERLDLNVNGTLDISAALNEAKRRALPMCDQQNVIDAETVETINLPMPQATGLEPVAAEKVAQSSDAEEKSPPDIFG